MISHLLGAVALLVAIAAMPATAQTNEPSGRPAPTQATVPANPRPPYLVSQVEILNINFEADEQALKSLLPPGIKPAAGNVVGLNIYRAEQDVGLIPYTASYLYINIDGFDSPGGIKGRWMVQGWYGPEPVPTVLKTQIGFPTQLGMTRVEREGNRVHAVLNSNGADLIDATIALKEGNPVPASLSFNYVVSGANITMPGKPIPSGLAVNHIPAIFDVTPASPVSADLHLRDTDAAKVLRPKRMLDAAYAKITAFAFGFVEPASQAAGASMEATAGK